MSNAVITSFPTLAAISQDYQQATITPYPIIEVDSLPFIVLMNPPEPVEGDVYEVDVQDVMVTVLNG